MTPEFVPGIDTTPELKTELESKSFELKRLVPRHFRIMDMHLQGLDHASIAAQLGISRMSVSLVVNSPLFQDALSKRRAVITRETDAQTVDTTLRANRVLEAASHEAAMTQVDLLSSEDERVRLQASNAILDRVLESKSNPGTRVTVISGEMLEGLRLALSESREARKLVTSTPIEQSQGVVAR
jgi:hypothetical protein